MNEIFVDGRKYVLSREAEDDLTREREELGRFIAEFTLEGELYWQKLFIKNDTNSVTGERIGMYGEGDEKAPFFTEAFLYNLLGKDDARSVLGIIRRLSALAGVKYR